MLYYQNQEFRDRNPITRRDQMLAHKKPLGVESLKILKKCLQFYNFNFHMGKRDSSYLQRLQMFMRLLPPLEELAPALN
jgi:hypothetical protein